VLLGATFLLWAGIFAWGVSRELVQEPRQTSPSRVRDAELFERHCASCHGLAEMRRAAGTKRDAARRAELERLLERHGDATADEDRQILDFLSGEM